MFAQCMHSYILHVFGIYKKFTRESGIPSCFPVHLSVFSVPSWSISIPYAPSDQCLLKWLKLRMSPDKSQCLLSLEMLMRGRCACHVRQQQRVVCQKFHSMRCAASLWQILKSDITSISSKGPINKVNTDREAEREDADKKFKARSRHCPFFGEVRVHCQTLWNDR